MRKVWIFILNVCSAFVSGILRGHPASLLGPQPGKMATPDQIAGEFENWLNERLDSLEVDREVYGAYILGVLREEENDEEQKDALQGILSAFLVSARACSCSCVTLARSTQLSRYYTRAARCQKHCNI